MKYLNYLKKNISSIEILSLLLFVFFIPLISKVNFMQNDDWNRTTSVVRFLLGDFSLLQVTATTFYTQGILGLLFSLFFGWKNLPFLTLLFSVLNFFIFAKIIFKHFNLSKFNSIFLSLLLFFTPLHIYSSIGFMTENYTLFFMLLAIFFFLEYEKSLKKTHFILFNLSGLLSFFTKQNGFIFNVAAIFYFLFNKRYKEALIQLGFVTFLISYYFFLFPRTREMRSKGFIAENFIDLKYTYSLFYGILLVTVSFILPLVIFFIIKTILNNRKSYIKIVFILISSVFCFIILNKYFMPGKISWEEYPYFENTFERTGFFPRSIMGTKYHFRWNYDIFKYWDIGSKIALSLLLPCIILWRKKIINIYTISVAGYLLLMIFTKIFYDRYILPLIPLCILMFLYLNSIESTKNKIDKYFSVILVPFVVFTVILSSQMAIDFVNTNNYVWGKSEELVQSGIYPSEIKSTMAWYKLYGVDTNPKYMFSFSSPNTEPKYLTNYSLKEEKDLGFKGNIFVNPRLYLYKRN